MGEGNKKSKIEYLESKINELEAENELYKQKCHRLYEQLDKRLDSSFDLMKMEQQYDELLGENAEIIQKYYDEVDKNAKLEVVIDYLTNRLANSRFSEDLK